MRTRALVAPLVAVVLTVGVAACGGGGSDVATPSDPILAKGQQVYNDRCASCHGKSGQGGGGGSRLAGVVENRYTLEEQVQVISGGRSGGMPAFAGRLTAEEIEAVARYEREVL